MKYAAANATGGIANNSVYALLVSRSLLFARVPPLAVAAGSIAGLVFNFTATRAWVYRPAPPNDPSREPIGTQAPHAGRPCGQTQALAACSASATRRHSSNAGR